MLHPGKEIAARLEVLGLTQKAFSQQIGKRVSEINELIKGKRNITLAWDYLLANFFKTEEKYRIYQQIEYDYVLLKQQESQKQQLGTKNQEEDEDVQRSSGDIGGEVWQNISEIQQGELVLSDTGVSETKVSDEGVFGSRQKDFPDTGLLQGISEKRVVEGGDTKVYNEQMVTQPVGVGQIERSECVLGQIESSFENFFGFVQIVEKGVPCQGEKKVPFVVDQDKELGGGLNGGQQLASNNDQSSTQEQKFELLFRDF